MRRSIVPLELMGIVVISFGCQPSEIPSEAHVGYSWAGQPPAMTSPIGDPRDDREALDSALFQFKTARSWSEAYADLVKQGSGEIANTASPRFQPGSPDLTRGDDFLADLIGATIVDVQDELTRCGRSIRDRSAAETPRIDWTLAPPWPPESVSQLIRRRMRRGEDPGPWVATLAAQLAPDQDTRSWLLESWARPRRPVDGKFLGELATAAHGRLRLEPRFRAWLRGEWRAWARQKYRLIERQAREKTR